MHSWIFRHILQLEAIYGRRARLRSGQRQAPLGPGALPVFVLIPLPRSSAPGKAA